MIKLQLAPSSHVSCNVCKKKIVKGEMRLREGTDKKYYIKYIYYCYICAKKRLDDEIIYINELKDDLKGYKEIVLTAKQFLKNKGIKIKHNGNVNKIFDKIRR